MTDTKASVLPFWETINRSFKYFFKNIDLYAKLGSIGAVVILFDMFSNFPTLCSMRGIDCTGNWQQAVSSVLLMLISVGVIVLYCRKVILKSYQMGRAAFARSVVIYILFSLFVLIVIAIPSMILMFLYGAVMPNAGERTILDMVVFAIPLLLAIAVAPLFLIFPAIAVEDKSFTLKNVFARAKGSHNSIFWGQFLMMIPCTLAIVVLTFIYQAIGGDNYFVNEIFVILVIALSLMDSCFKASYYAHVYQFFKYQESKK